ncbi:MAG: hypothetical protein ACRD30_07030, partial [Bryobacteraceae bacterium]
VKNFLSLEDIDSSQPLTVQWNPSGYSSADVVTASVSSGSRQVTCRAHATDGQLTIASSLLNNGATNASLQISLNRRPDRMVRADVPLLPSGVAPGIFTYSFTESFPVQIH